MSMIEKFLEEKEALCKKFDDIRDEAFKEADMKCVKLFDGFMEDFRAMIAEASDEEFVSFITSGKLDDEDLNVAIMLRAEVRNEKECEAREQIEEDEEDERWNVHVFLLD